MKLLAQLPTPTIATRTFSSARPTPFVCPLAPLLSLMNSEVLLDCAGWLKTPGGFAGYTSPAAAPSSSLTPEASPESSFLTCHTRWNVVNIVKAAIA
jgi:hypothetical protein